MITAMPPTVLRIGISDGLISAIDLLTILSCLSLFSYSGGNSHSIDKKSWYLIKYALATVSYTHLTLPTKA